MDNCKLFHIGSVFVFILIFLLIIYFLYCIYQLDQDQNQENYVNLTKKSPVSLSTCLKTCSADENCRSLVFRPIDLETANQQMAGTCKVAQTFQNPLECSGEISYGKMYINKPSLMKRVCTLDPALTSENCLCNSDYDYLTSVTSSTGDYLTINWDDDTDNLEKNVKTVFDKKYIDRLNDFAAFDQTAFSDAGTVYEQFDQLFTHRPEQINNNNYYVSNCPQKKYSTIENFDNTPISTAKSVYNYVLSPNYIPNHLVDIPTTKLGLCLENMDLNSCQSLCSNTDSCQGVEWNPSVLLSNQIYNNICCLKNTTVTNSSDNAQRALYPNGKYYSKMNGVSTSNIIQSSDFADIKSKTDELPGLFNGSQSVTTSGNPYTSPDQFLNPCSQITTPSISSFNSNESNYDLNSQIASANSQINNQKQMTNSLASTVGQGSLSKFPSGSVTEGFGGVFDIPTRVIKDFDTSSKFKYPNNMCS